MIASAAALSVTYRVTSLTVAAAPGARAPGVRSRHRRPERVDSARQAPGL